MAEKKPFYKRAWFLIVVGLLLLSGIGNAIGGSETSSPDSARVETSPTPTESAQIESSPSASESPESMPSSDPNSEDNVSYFIASSNGQFSDLNKDIDDAIKRAKNDQTIRLLGNILEFSFNFGQLEALDVPDSIAKDWKSGMSKLDLSIDAASDAATDFVVDDASVSEVVTSLEKVRSRVNSLAKTVGKLE